MQVPEDVPSVHVQPKSNDRSAESGQGHQAAKAGRKDLPLLPQRSQGYMCEGRCNLAS